MSVLCGNGSVQVSSGLLHCVLQILTFLGSVVSVVVSAGCPLSGFSAGALDLIIRLLDRGFLRVGESSVQTKDTLDVCGRHVLESLVSVLERSANNGNHLVQSDLCPVRCCLLARVGKFSGSLTSVGLVLGGLPLVVLLVSRVRLTTPDPSKDGRQFVTTVGDSSLDSAHHVGSNTVELGLERRSSAAKRSGDSGSEISRVIDCGVMDRRNVGRDIGLGSGNGGSQICDFVQCRKHVVDHGLDAG